MSLLREIQASLMEQDQDIGPILLKLRYLSSRLGGDILEDWVRHESEGYPNDAELPDYRIVGVNYKLDAFGPLQSGVRNAPVPTAIVKEHAGSDWTEYQVRQSVTSIGSLLHGDDAGGTLIINASNLALVLQGKIYPNYNIAAVTGEISKASMVEIQSVVRSRILELTIQLEKDVPIAADINLGQVNAAIGAQDLDRITQLTQYVIHGNATSITSQGDGNALYLSIDKGNKEQLLTTLIDNGIDAADAEEIATIIASEDPESASEPFGKKAKSWIADKIGRAADGTWQAGLSVATKVLTEAAMKYYGLK